MSQTGFCLVCRKEVEYNKISKMRTWTHPNDEELKVEYESVRCHCRECEAMIFVSEVHNENIERIQKQVELLRQNKQQRKIKQG